MPSIAVDDPRVAIEHAESSGASPTSMPVSDNEHLGESGMLSYTLPSEEKPNIAKGFMKGVESTPQILGQFVSYLGHNLDPRADETQIRNGSGFGDRIARLGIEMMESNKKYIAEHYPETPDLWEKIGQGVGGALPLAAMLGVGAFTGADETMLTALAAGGIAATTNVSAFSMLKDKGLPTLSADLMALIPAGAAGALTAAGMGTFMKMAGEPIAALAKGAINGYATMAIQSGAVGEIEHLEGINNEPLVNRLSQYAVDGVVGAIFGGPLGMHSALMQHAKIETGLKEFGLDAETAHDAAKVIMSKAMGEGLDKAEQLAGRKAQDEGRLSSISSDGTTLDSQYPSVSNKEPLDAADVARQSQGNKYVVIHDLDMKVMPTDKATAAKARAEVSGNINAQIDKGNYLREDVQKAAPKEQEAMTLSEEAHFGDKDFLRRLLNEPEKTLSELQKILHDRSGSTEPFEVDAEKLAKGVAYLKSIVPYLNQALNLSEGAQKSLDEGRIFYKESGDVGKAFGTLKDILDNYYSKRAWKPLKNDDYVKTQGRTGLPQFSPSSLQRVYENIFEGIADGREPATLNYGDLLGMKNQEMSIVNHSRQLLDVMANLKPFSLVKWRQLGDEPAGWKQIGRLSKEQYMRDSQGELITDKNDNPILIKHFAFAPEGIADGLKALTDPDKLRQLPGIKTFQKLQGIDKTFDLAFSTFHPITFVAQAITAPHGARILMDYIKQFGSNFMSGEEFRNRELDAAHENVITTKSQEMQDIQRGMNKGDDAISKALQAPIAKQITDIAQKFTSWMFDDFQRFLKVNTHYYTKMDWKLSHPDATAEEIHAAGQSIGNWTNAHYGGMNWEALGVDRTTQSFLRTTFLAPDWLTAMITNTKYASVDWKTPAGTNARIAGIKMIVGGYALGNIASMMLTGHPMWDNKKGHKFEIEVAPDVYFAPIRGPAGELLKLASNVWESGGPHGLFRYGEGKLAPFASAGLMLASGVNYYGGNIWKGKTPLQQNVTAFWNVVGRIAPVPFSATGAINYGEREQEHTPFGWAAVATGAGRFSKAGGKKSKASSFESTLKSDLAKAEWLKPTEVGQ